MDMKIRSIILAVAILAVSAACAKPNIVFILADDLGSGDVGWSWQGRRHGAEVRIATPNLDRLAGEGTVLPAHYCAAPVCAPSRASILTGRLQKPNGCSVRNNMFDHPITERDTIASVLKGAGYHTLAIGKWGVGGDNGPADEYGADTRFFQSAGPFDGFKRDVYEGGMRVPTFVWGLQGPKTDPSPSIATDWMATFADLAGVQKPALCDGVSLLPRWTGGRKPEPSKIQSSYNGCWSNQPDFQEFAARKGQLVRGEQEMRREGNIVTLRAGGTDKPWRRYDVVSDPHQDHDLNSQL